VLTSGAAERIEDLVRLGVPFDTVHGEIALAREGRGAAALWRAAAVVSMVCRPYNGSGMARGQENPNPLQLIGMGSVIALFFAVGVIGIVRGDLVLAIVFLSITVAFILFMIVVYVSARRRLVVVSLK